MASFHDGELNAHMTRVDLGVKRKNPYICSSNFANRASPTHFFIVSTLSVPANCDRRWRGITGDMFLTALIFFFMADAVSQHDGLNRGFMAEAASLHGGLGSLTVTVKKACRQFVIDGVGQLHGGLGSQHSHGEEHYSGVVWLKWELISLYVSSKAIGTRAWILIQRIEGLYKKEMLLLLLPLLNSSTFKNIFRPFSKDKSSSSSEDDTTCPICQASPTTPFLALPCQHRYCYYCLRTRCAAAASFRCSRCSEPVIAMQRHGVVNHKVSSQ